MDIERPVLLYIGSKLPCISETFVYNEILNLQERGWTVYAASIHEPDLDFGDLKVETMALDSIKIYPQGLFGITKNVIKETFSNPKTVFATIGTSIKTIVKNRNELSFGQAIKFLVQTIAAISIADKVRSCSITHIHSHFAHVPTSIAMILSKHLSIPFSFTGHAVDLFSESCLLKEKLQRAAFCVCISNWHKEFYKSIFHLPDDQLPVIRCGIDTETFFSKKESTTDDEEIRIISVSRLVPKKGVDLLVKALEKVDFGKRKWSCQIIGDGPEKKRLEELVAQSKYSRNIHILGSLPNETVRDMLQHSNIFVLPCRIDEEGNRDGIPVAIMEAMSCENAVISGDLPPFHELIEHGVSGFITKLGDSDEISQYIEKLVNNSHLCKQLGHAGRKRIVEEFSSELNIQRLQTSFLHSHEVPSESYIQFIKSFKRQLQKTDNYVIISPCRNEEKYLRNTLESVVKQTVLPKKWVIIDDGSTDDTPKVLKEYAEKHPFIQVIRREDRGFRQVGPGVVDTFYVGYNSIEPSEYDYVCKLDLDLKLPNKYFETLITKMKADPRIGTCSGRPYFVNPNGALEMEPSSDDISVGMTKFYRTKCFSEMNGIVRGVMWDGIDCHKSRMLGWTSYSWDEPHLRFIHLRPMGSSEKGIITGRIRYGYGQYFMGTSWLYITVSSLYRMTKYPLFVGGLSIWLGYMKALFTNAKQYDDKQFRNFLHRYQHLSLLRGKKAASQITNEETLKIWNEKIKSGNH